MKPEDLYHRGIVVNDLDAAKKWLTDTLGYRWCDEYAGEQEVETPGGQTKVQIHFAYSLDEPRLELLQAVPGTVWVPSDSGIHHLGYWSDDVDGDVRSLVADGATVQVKAPGGDAESLWAYLMTPTGIRVELVSRAIEPLMRDWFATGRSPLA